MLDRPRPDTRPAAPRRGGILGAVVLLPLLAGFAYLEVVAAIGDSLDDVRSSGHHVTGPLWLGIFAILGVAGPAAFGVTAWHTRAEHRGRWQALLRGEMAFLLIGVPALLLLFVT